MEFEYNGNLVENERVELVANEIMKLYPEIDFSKAKAVAFLEEPITTSVNDVMHFKRLYNILMLCYNEKALFSKVLSDLNVIYRKIMNESSCFESVDVIMNELSKFIIGERIDFPLISEFC